MAYQGGHVAASQGRGNPFSFEAIPELLTAAIKKAQTPAGVFVPPSSYNDSQYGAVGPWRVEGEGSTIRLPKFKFTIKKGHTHSLTLTIKEPDFRIWNVPGVLHQHAMSYRPGYYKVAQEFTQERRMPMHSDEWTKVESDIQSIAASYNYDKSDLQTDYFQYGFSLDVRPDPKLAEGNTQRAERVISELEVAFPAAWEKILAEAAGEAQWAFHQKDSQIGTSRRDELDRAMRRAKEGVESGVARVEFKPDRPGTGWRIHSSSTVGRYYARERKRAGKGGGEIVARVASVAGQEIFRGQAPKSFRDYLWRVERLSQYVPRTRDYEQREIVAEGAAENLERAIDDAGRAFEEAR